jgi:excinuclease UvrABC ATPase subunit
MKKTFTPEYVKENSGCYERKVEHLSFIIKPEITAVDIVNSEIPLRDKYWFVCKKLATKEENQKIAIGVAEIVLPLFEKRYPDDKRPREAIEAAKQYAAGRISVENLKRKHMAADDAADAAYADISAASAAADAAASAADACAACAACTSDTSAAYAAYAASAAYTSACAACAACTSAYAADMENQLKYFLLEQVNSSL